ncbi:bifunctional folylpolyglutamate synthase/dihydrofolate synthase [Ktedonosporobacter rubrisoli]|uniref:tetrahydrofolate synthase n=1 Tax=Ktedonosporobacter rubrisoli TaxID=2509675 RepID=A0A4P6JSD7_KTERU|nr:folylpolyglutamate synthase/dihydrofolate synthase family protein [Ktedonosporobacter rubrisoli]QBD78304.1 bifunctional folylpolyglutamate synthase/dihydrofolate synthase [Ktedonosporobacter rubrisoli]
MNYQEALTYIYSFADFERSGSYVRDVNENLPREARLLEFLGNPQQAYSSTLIAGTKGKGSTAICIEGVLRAAGLRTGLYTQPDLHTFRERMRVNGQLISEEEMAALIPKVRSAVEAIQARKEFGPFITYELATALAFFYFAHQHVQHAVVEVGLGGRLDATNVLQPLVSVITSISYDHMQILGNTLTSIATEKAGIIKEHGYVVTSAQATEALLAIAAVCQAREARLIRVGPAEGDPAQEAVDAGALPPLSYRYKLERREGGNLPGQRFTVLTPERVYTDLQIPLPGLHQLENATAALATLEVLRKRSVAWNEDALRQGLLTAHWPARMQIVGYNPTMLVDGAHNADSMHKLVEALHTSFATARRIFVLSVARDKDLSGIVKELADADCVVLTAMQNARVASIEALAKLFAELAPSVKVYTAATSDQAIERALSLSTKEDLICITGSLYLAGEALRWAAAHGNAEVAAEIKGVDH